VRLINSVKTSVASTDENRTILKAGLDLFSKQCTSLMQIKNEILDPALAHLSALATQPKEDLIHQQEQPSWVESTEVKTIKSYLRRQLSQALVSDKIERQRFDFDNQHIKDINTQILNGTANINAKALGLLYKTAIECLKEIQVDLQYVLSGI
jgi:hypothetical protein